jgi:hypothetical protein
MSSAKRRWWWVLAAGLAVSPVAALLAVTIPQEREEFPHERHAGLFPLCSGCHQGIESGTPDELYPTPASCTSCHDGVALPRATFTPDVSQPSNLSFDHDVHVSAVARLARSPLACGACHTTPGAPRMTVDPLGGARCVACHEPPGADHFVDADCATCHVPLAESSLTLERIEALVVPADHETGSFIRGEHGRLVLEQSARCATCHTQERCVACHVDATRPEIARIPAAPPGMALPARVAHYPLPESHRSPSFETRHGSLAEGDAARCATCHTQDDCASCHLPPLPAVAAGLPSRSEVAAPGVELEVAVPGSHLAPTFERTHGTLAASGPGSCASCHTQPFCSQCHQAADRPVFHEANFVARHAADAWGRNLECANCHEVQVFCRSCHTQSGLGAQGRLRAGFHDAEPVWLLRHGQAARQSLENCASCHAQNDCVGCHSQLGAFKVNPHGPAFEARRAWERNPGICLACHVGSPFGGGA